MTQFTVDEEVQVWYNNGIYRGSFRGYLADKKDCCIVFKQFGQVIISASDVHKIRTPKDELVEQIDYMVETMKNENLSKEDIIEMLFTLKDSANRIK